MTSIAERFSLNGQVAVVTGAAEELAKALPLISLTRVQRWRWLPDEPKRLSE